MKIRMVSEMSNGKVADIVNSQTKTLLDQIEVFRILLKEMSVKLSQYESTIQELQHYAEEGSTGIGHHQSMPVLNVAAILGSTIWCSVGHV